MCKDRIGVACVVVACLLAHTNSAFAAKTTEYLSNDVTLDCTDSFVHSSLAFTETMTTGQDLWVYGRVDAELINQQDTHVGVTLACQAGSSFTASPSSTAKQSDTSWNLFVDGLTEDTYEVMAVYEAESDGPHTCWLVPICFTTGKKVRILDTSRIVHYSPDQYPGKNFPAPITSDVDIDSTTHKTHMTALWDAFDSSQYDSEVVAYYSPKLTKCNDPDDSQCESIDPFIGNSFDGEIYYRLVLYQYTYDAVTEEHIVCEKRFNQWLLLTLPNDAHHWGPLLKAAWPITTGQGTYDDCGSASGDRSFKVWAQLKKVSSSSFAPDVAAHMSTTTSPRTNISIYTR